MGRRQEEGAAGFVQGLTAGFLKQQEREDARQKRREEFEDKVRLLDIEYKLKAGLDASGYGLAPRERRLREIFSAQEEAGQAGQALEQTPRGMQVIGGRLQPVPSDVPTLSEMSPTGLSSGELQAIRQAYQPLQQTQQATFQKAQQRATMAQQRLGGLLSQTEQATGAFRSPETLTQTEEFRDELIAGITAVRNGALTREQAIQRLKDAYPDKGSQIEEAFFSSGI